MKAYEDTAIDHSIRPHMPPIGFYPPKTMLYSDKATYGAHALADKACPFKNRCPYHEPCRDHGWLCIWLTWLIPVSGIGFVSYLFWQGWHEGMFS